MIPIKNILLEGQPGSGKTTLIQKMIQRLSHLKLGGFTTEEIRESGERKGFRIRTLDGGEGILAHIDWTQGPRVGKYKVDVQTFEELVIPCMKQSVQEADVIFIDEIGKMELYSEKFRRAVMACLMSDVPVIASIMNQPHPVADQIRMRPDVKRIIVTRGEQGFIIEEVLEEIGFVNDEDRYLDQPG
jgi:nucleoside-triphosphatase THEP1